jgi:hypothetical protein
MDNRNAADVPTSSRMNPLPPGLRPPSPRGPALNLWERTCPRRLRHGQRKCSGCTGPFADEFAPTGTCVRPRHRGPALNLWERTCPRRLRHGQRKCSGCTNPFADESAPTGTCVRPRHRGPAQTLWSGLVREDCGMVSGNAADVPTPSRMSPLPPGLRAHCHRGTAQTLLERGLPAKPLTGLSRSSGVPSGVGGCASVFGAHLI